MVFGFSIGINVSYRIYHTNFGSRLIISTQTTNAVFLGSPPPLGYGFSQFGIAGAYGTPIVSMSLPRQRASADCFC